MRTKEAIADQHSFHAMDSDGAPMHVLEYPDVLLCMQEFSDQETAARDEKITALERRVKELQTRLDDCKRRAITGARL